MKAETNLTSSQVSILSALSGETVTPLKEAGDKRTLNALQRRGYISFKVTKKGTSVRVLAAGERVLNS